MKKILTLLIISVFLVSCWDKKDTEVENTPTENQETTSDTTDNTSDETPDSNTSENTDDASTNSTETNVSASWSAESPEELVDDFGAELESLFDLIEESE